MEEGVKASIDKATISNPALETIHRRPGGEYAGQKFLLEFIYIIVIRERKLAFTLSGIFALAVLYMLIIVMHKTMGGWHFGNRYSNDILPWIYLGTVLVHTKHPRLIKYQIPLAVAACALNLVGSIAVYNRWV